MPIRPFLDPNHPFDAETVRRLGLAFEMTCGALRLENRDPKNNVARFIADKLIELAKTGERNPNQLCDDVLAWAGSERELGPISVRLWTEGRYGEAAYLDRTSLGSR
jgi:hypothetical protein